MQALESVDHLELPVNKTFDTGRYTTERSLAAYNYSIPGGRNAQVMEIHVQDIAAVSSLRAPRNEQACLWKLPGARRAIERLRGEL